MDYDIGQVMPERVQVPEGVIEGMGNPRKGVPVACVKMGKGPFKQKQIYGPDDGVVHDIDIIVPVQKSISQSRQINCQRNKSDHRRKRILGISFCFHSSASECSSGRSDIDKKPVNL
jgi:hypothetical protein